MKKTNQIFKSIIAIAAVITSVSCTKEIEQPQNDRIGIYKAIPASQAVNSSVMINSNGYAGSGTLGDSTKTRRVVKGL